MNHINESDYVLVVVNQFIDNNNEEQSSNSTDLITMLKPASSASISTRPIYAIEQQNIPAIRSKIKEQNRILSLTYKGSINTMYSCAQVEANEKISAYMKHTNAYSVVCQFDDCQETIERTCLDFICERIKTTLDDLHDRKCISSIEYSIFTSHQSNVQLDQLFFQPDIRRVSTICVCMIIYPL
jgi:hypothetical protein